MRSAQSLEQRRAYWRTYRLAHKEQRRAVQKRWRETHKAQQASYAREWAAAHEIQTRDRSLLRKFGISSVEYDRMLNEQHGVCKLCSEPCSTGKRLAVDHDHVTGRIRGLLCAKCNTSIGLVDRIGVERVRMYLATDVTP